MVQASSEARSFGLIGIIVAGSALDPLGHSGNPGINWSTILVSAAGAIVVPVVYPAFLGARASA